MNSDFQDGLFAEALVERVERPEDGTVETGAGVKKRFKAFEPDAVMLVPPSLDEWLPSGSSPIWSRRSWICPGSMLPMPRPRASRRMTRG